MPIISNHRPRMETCIQRGTRVIRGPDWTYRDQDGGKGHAGTVLSLQAVYRPYFAKQTVLVQWDNGEKGLYRTGYNQAYDLRILETAKSGRHLKIWCDACNLEEIKGIRWRCTECYAFDLCTTCYMNDEHDLSHVFMRVMSSHKTSKGIKMLPRSSSPHIPLRGSFPGAKVVRHPHWCMRNRTAKQLGRVVKTGQTPEQSIGVQAVVDFSCTLESVDFTEIICTLPGSGGHVYDGHLPNLGELETVGEGDKVLVTATPPEMKELHERRGLWDPDMVKTCGRKGFVNKRTNTGDFTVTFHDTQETFTMNSAALRKLHRFCLGQLVRISDDIKMVKRLQFGHGGWNPTMKQVIGKVGKIVKIEGSDINVKTKDQTFVFSSANLVPARIPFHRPKERSMAEFWNIALQMSEAEVDIVMAVASGDIPLVKRMLKNHPELVHHEPKPGKTLLSVTVANKDVRMMKFLVEKGCFIESYDEKGCTPLFLATDVNNFEGVRFLLEQGADVDSANCEGLTSFAVACSHGSFECAHYLLMHGADVNMKSKDDYLPIIRAIENEGRTILDLILARKEIDLKAVSTSLFMSSMHYAALGGNTYALTKLMEKAPRMVEAQQCNGNTPIFCAGYASSLKATEVLIKKGHCNVNAQTNGDQTCPLHLALYKENFHLIEVLMKNGANANITIRAGDSCLQMAFDVLDSIESEERCIKEEPFMSEMKKKWGHVGIKTNGDALLAYLVSHGGDLDVYNCDNITIRESLQLKSKDALLRSLDQIQSLTRKDIAKQQSTANYPPCILTKNCPGTVAEAEHGCSVLKKCTATPETKKQSASKSSEKSSTSSARPVAKTQSAGMSSARPVAKTQSAGMSSEKSSSSSARPVAKTQSAGMSSEKSSTSSARPVAKTQGARVSSEKSPTSSSRPVAKTQSARMSSEKSSTSSARPVAKTQSARMSSEKSSTSSARPGTKIQSARNAPEKSSTSSARPVTKTQSASMSLEKSSTSSPRPGTEIRSAINSSGKSSMSSGSQQKSAGKETTNACERGAGDSSAQNSKNKPSDTDECNRLQTELQHKNDQLKVLRSRVETLEHLVKKKISFACGHDVTRSIAELIPECPNCSEPIASVVDAH
ncbi:E3 ubiquitin-protein ligase MIB2 isoform X1 [Strongylocentrotus purpuratus]|uniref:RING-type E3 ubiquitin transferase n=2 Tax=Strongylocentrotus purpuratus TaxID=7668 RepID=A0A7M7NJA6_STRPU|nr:E3 ubiquitin-protein ligase MIB2 isoform X1 [Strongylocentrotus purpuratus]